MAMTSRRIHITGASGSGATTLGRALADRLALAHHDTDDYYWRPTVPPYQTKRSVEDRLRLMEEVFLPRLDWVLSGSLDGWGDPLIPKFDLVVFLSVEADIRMARLRDREARHFGVQASAPGGWRHQATEDFITWASGYDGGGQAGRTRARHEAWLDSLPCPVLRLDSTKPVHELVDAVARALGEP